MHTETGGVLAGLTSQLPWTDKAPIYTEPSYRNDSAVVTCLHRALLYVTLISDLLPHIRFTYIDALAGVQCEAPRTKTGRS